jgi:uncharacterized protein (DUF952 family)
VLIYKLLATDEWRAAKALGEYRGSAVDLADGFVHFSTGEQVVATAALYFDGRTGLTMLTVDPARLGVELLRWEPSRGGALFPHLYAPLPVTEVIAEADLPAAVPVAEAVAQALADGLAELNR